MEFYKCLNKNILITGGAGFIGSNFIHYYLKRNSQDKLFVIDKLSYSGNINNISSLIKEKKITFFKEDICNESEIEKILSRNKISHIIHFAAESHVDRSINKPDDFIKTNIQGTFVLLKSFQKEWAKKKNKNWRFIHISTDEVFGSLEINQPSFEETTPYNPRSPYSASKAASDHMVSSWFHTFGLPTIVSNCSNNYGPYQFPEKLIPLTIKNIIKGELIPVYGNGQNIRDWIYVDDHCEAIDKVLNKGEVGGKYCIGGDCEVKNIDLVKNICDLVDSLAIELNISIPISPSRKLINFVEDRKGHDLRYSINNSHIEKQLLWKPKISLSSGLTKTIRWYLENINFLESNRKNYQ